jgi:carbonic anhydrase
MVAMRRAFGLLAVASAFLFACWPGGRALAQTSSSAVVAASDFAYTGDKGPAFWAESAHAPACAPSPTARQSPIDISRVVPDRGLAPLNLDLEETSVVLNNSGYNVRGVPAIRQELILNGDPYEMIEFHFHTLSEHTVDGRQGVMELHAVFRDEDTKTQLAVIGVIYKIGKPNAFLRKLLVNGLPQKSTSPHKVVGSIDVSKAFTNTSRYYTYPGSLTTPPCGPTVQWFVLQDWAEMSPQQFQTFHDVVGNNFRPLQARNGRVIRQTTR